MPPRRIGSSMPRLPKLRGPAYLTRGPRGLQRVLLATPNEATSIPRPQSYFGGVNDGRDLRTVAANGSEPEWRVFWGLLSLGYMPGVDFEYQGTFFGGRARGGAVPDFVVYPAQVAIDVQGFHWHYGSTAIQASDLLQAAAVESRGIRMIFIDEQDAMTRPRAVVAAAVRGEDWSQLLRRS